VCSDACVLPVQVHTSSMPSFFVSWWFRPTDAPSPQMTRHQQGLQTKAAAAILDSCAANPRSDSSSTAPRPTFTVAPACAPGAGEMDLGDSDGSGMDLGDPGGPSQSISQIVPSSPSFSVGALRLTSMAHPLQLSLPATPPSAGSILTPQRKTPRDPRKPGTPEDTDMSWQPDADYVAFYQVGSSALPLESCLWTSNVHRRKPLSASEALQKVPVEMQHRVAQVVKDKDVPLRNATITDDILPQGRKIVHINCVAHAHMHLDKSAAGNLEVREALGWCMGCLKNIDESNKVCVCAVVVYCMFHGAHAPFAASTAAHDTFSCTLQPMSASACREQPIRANTSPLQPTPASHALTQPMRLFHVPCMRRCPATRHSSSRCCWT
jgi:hypothetical protein